MKAKLVFLDTETTGLKEADRLCQLAYKVEDIVVNELFNPGLPIEVGAMAVHHITNDMVKGKPMFKETSHYKLLKGLLEEDTTFLVAHNATFDIGMLKKEGIVPTKWIDTLKVSRYLDTEKKLKSHALQNLRYHFEIKEEATAHDALGDIVILEKIFWKLFDLAESKAKEKTGKDKVSKEKIFDRMKQLSMDFMPVDVMPWGKHQGKKLADIFRDDRSYLTWILNKRAKDGEKDDELVTTIKKLFRQ